MNTVQCTASGRWTWIIDSKTLFIMMYSSNVFWLTLSVAYNNTDTAHYSPIHTVHWVQTVHKSTQNTHSTLSTDSTQEYTQYTQYTEYRHYTQYRQHTQYTEYRHYTQYTQYTEHTVHWVQTLHTVHWHPARKWSESILTIPEPTRGWKQMEGK